MKNWKFLVTLFPKLVEEWKNIGIVRQAIKNELVNIQTTDLREYGIGDYKQVDDSPYGGGPGMVLMPEPLDNAIKSFNYEVNVFLTPSGGNNWMKYYWWNYYLLSQ